MGEQLIDAINAPAGEAAAVTAAAA